MVGFLKEAAPLADRLEIRGLLGYFSAINEPASLDLELTYDGRQVLQARIRAESGNVSPSWALSLLDAAGSPIPGVDEQMYYPAVESAISAAIILAVGHARPSG